MLTGLRWARVGRLTLAHAHLASTTAHPAPPPSPTPSPSPTTAALAHLHALTRRSPAAKAARAAALTSGDVRLLLNTLADLAAADALSPAQTYALCTDLVPLAPYRHRLYSMLPRLAAAHADALPLPHLIKLGWIFTKLGADASADAGYMVRVAHHAGAAGLAAVEPKDSTLLAWCLAKAAAGAPGPAGADARAAAVTVLDAVLAAVPAALPRYEPRSIPVLLWSMVNTGVAPPRPALDALATYAADNVARFTPRDFTSTLWGLCKLGRPDTTLFAAAAHPPRTKALLAGSPEDLVSLAWCLGQTPLAAHAKLKSAVTAALAARADALRMRQLARALAAAGRFSAGALPHPLLAAAAQRFVDLDPLAASPQEAANIAYALGRGLAALPRPARASLTPIVAPAFSGLARVAPSLINSFSAQGLANSAYAFAKAGMGSPRLVQTLAARLLAPDRLPNATSSELVMTVWALAASSGPSETYFAAVDELVSHRLAACSPQEVSIVLWSLRTAGSSPRVTAAFETIAETMRAHLPDYDVRSICSAAFSFAKAGHSSVAQFVLFTAMQSEVMARAPDLAPPDLANMAWASSRSSSFSRPFYDFLLSAIADALPRFSPHALKLVVSAVTQADSLSFEATHPVFAALDETVAARLDTFSPGWITAVAVSFARAGVPFPATAAALTHALPGPFTDSFHASMGLAWALHTASGPTAAAPVGLLADAMVGHLVSGKSGAAAHVLAGLSTSNLVRALIVLDAAGILARAPHVVAMFDDVIASLGPAFVNGFGSPLVPLPLHDVVALLSRHGIAVAAAPPLPAE